MNAIAIVHRKKPTVVLLGLLVSIGMPPAVSEI